MFELHTERLTLRPHRRTDFADMCRLWGDAAVTRHIGGKPFSQEDVWMRLLRYAGTWSLMGYGMFRVGLRDGNAYVGDAGFICARRDVEPRFDDIPELGYVLMPMHHGKGFATETARAVLGWGERELGIDETVCMIDTDHSVSLAVASKIGFVKWTEATYKDAAVTLLKRKAATGVT